MTRDEKDLQRAIMQALHRIGVLAWEVKMGSRGHVSLGVRSKRHPTGFPDVLACVRGLFVALEVKLPGKEQRGSKERLEAQALCRRDILDHDGFAAVVTSVDEALEVVAQVKEQAA